MGRSNQRLDPPDSSMGSIVPAQCLNRAAWGFHVVPRGGDLIRLPW